MISYYHLSAPVALHPAAQKLLRSLSVSAFGGKEVDDHVLMIDRAPKIMLDPIDPHKNFLDMPTPK